MGSQLVFSYEPRMLSRLHQEAGVVGYLVIDKNKVFIAAISYFEVSQILDQSCMILSDLKITSPKLTII